MAQTSRPLPGTAFAAILLAGTTLAGRPSHAEVKATLTDRFEQIVSTFMGDPAANVDIDMKHVLDTWRAQKPKPLEDLTADDARRQPTPIEAAAILLKNQGKPLTPSAIDVKDITFPGPDGSLKARIYTPNGQAPDKPRPVVVFYHGGGFVLENGASTDATSRALAGTGFIVIAPDYRLAPENKFPAAQNDSLSAYKWVLENAASFGGEPDKIALAGEGAGGLLAADTAIAARDGKLQKASALVLITPAAGINLKTNSWMEDSAARPWNDKAVAWALNLYLPKPDDKNDPRIDLVGKTDVDNLPPTIIVTAEIDPLRSDGERLGGKLRIATVPVAMRDYAGVTHDFFGMGEAVEKAATAQRFVSDELKKAFAPKVNDAVALEDLGIAPYPEAPGPAVAPAPERLAVPKVTQQIDKAAKAGPQAVPGGMAPAPAPKP